MSKRVPSGFPISTTSALLLVLFSFLTPSAFGQECGEFCAPCGLDRYEGIGTSGEDRYDLHCRPGYSPEPDMDEWCWPCEGGSPVTDFTEAKEIAALIDSIRVGELSAVVEGFRSRLLLNPQRRLLVVRATRCGPDVIGRLVFLSQEKAGALQQLGVVSEGESVRPTG